MYRGSLKGPVVNGVTIRLVWHNTNFATVDSQVTVCGCSVEYEYKFLRQFAHVVAHRMPFTSVLSICTTEAFLAELLTVIMQCSHHHGNCFIIIFLMIIEAHEALELLFCVFNSAACGMY